MTKTVPYVSGDLCIESLRCKDDDGYSRIRTNGRVFQQHRLILSWKLGRPIRPGYCALHTCDNPGCIRPEHLWEGTHIENMADKMSKGREPRGGTHPRRIDPSRWDGSSCVGTAHPQAKLTDQDVREIRRQALEGVSLTAIARQYGLTRNPVYKITKNLTWRHVV